MLVVRLRYKEEFEFEFTFTLIRAQQWHSQILCPTDPWLRSRHPTRPYLHQGPISEQPRDAMATANPCYRRGLAVASRRAHRGALWEVSPSSSLVGRWSVVRDLNLGRRSTGGRRRRKVGVPSQTAACCPPATGSENWAHGVTGFFPLTLIRTTGPGLAAIPASPGHTLIGPGAAEAIVVEGRSGGTCMSA